MQRHKEVPLSHWKPLAFSVAILGLGQGALSQTAAAEVFYRATPLGSLGTDAYPSDINASGDVAGGSTLSSPQQHAFLYGKPPGSSQPTLIDLGTLGGQNSYGYGLNDLSSVVGTAQTSAGISHAFVYKGGVMTDLHSLLSGQSSSAAGINNSEHVVGTWRGTDSVNQAFLLADGVRIALGTLGGMESFPSAVNNTDQVVGSSDLASGVDHAFLYTRANGEMADLGTLGGTFSYASDISDTGFVTGHAALNNDAGTRAFLYKSSTGMVNLGTLPGGGQSRGSGVNDAGQVVGFAVASDFSLKAFVYTDGQLRDLNTLIDAAQPLPQGIELTDALGINNQGWIVAEGYNASTDQTTPYLLIPVVNSADSD